MIMAPLPQVLEPTSLYDTWPKLAYRMSHEEAGHINKLIFANEEERGNRSSQRQEVASYKVQIMLIEAEMSYFEA